LIIIYVLVAIELVVGLYGLTECVHTCREYARWIRDWSDVGKTRG